MLPEEFVRNMKTLLGDERFHLLESSYAQESVQALRLNPLKKKSENSADIAKLMELEGIPYEESGYYFNPEFAPGRRPFHDAGVYYIQDPGAMVPGAVLTQSEFFKRLSESEEGIRVIDLCASPGGKSTQIAQVMAGKGLLVSNEINRSRADVLSCNIERMGITNAIVLNESTDKLAERFEGYFDAVIVDAPCSGEGMFRKDPDAIAQWSTENVKVCAERQKEILENAYRMLKAGGVLVYSTCTFEKEENEDRVAYLMELHPDMKLEDISYIKDKAAGCMDGTHPYEKTVRLMPPDFKGEGQFSALLSKGGDSENALPFGGYETGSRIKDMKALETFLKDSLTDEAADRILEAKARFRLFGDNLYIMPEDTPSLSGLKVLRCGLCIGTFKKDRFEPAHALALALGKGDAKLSIDTDEDAAESYVRGMTLEGEGNGWCLVCVCGYSLGWGKVSNGRVKNHYPKGLRIVG